MKMTGWPLYLYPDMQLMDDEGDLGIQRVEHHRGFIVKNNEVSKEFHTRNPGGSGPEGAKAIKIFTSSNRVAKKELGPGAREGRSLPLFWNDEHPEEAQ